MTEFLQEEEIYRLSDHRLNMPKEIVENIDTIVLLDKDLGDVPEAVSRALHKMLEVIGKQDSSEIVGPDDKYPFRGILSKWAPSYVIAFGLSPKMLDLNIAAKRNQIIQFESEKLLFAEGIELMSDGAKKKQLWQNLQVLFELT